MKFAGEVSAYIRRHGSWYKATKYAALKHNDEMAVAIMRQHPSGMLDVAVNERCVARVATINADKLGLSFNEMLAQIVDKKKWESLMGILEALGDDWNAHCRVLHQAHRLAKHNPCMEEKIRNYMIEHNFK